MYGQGRGVVVATGAQTEVGRIGAMVGQTPALATPLTKRLDQFARQITAYILVVGLVAFLYATLLGGLMTLIGTPPNLLISEVMAQNGFQPFELFDFTPLGGTIMVAGVLFIALIGRFMLPKTRTDRGRFRHAGGL